MIKRKSIDGLIIRETASDDINAAMLSHARKNTARVRKVPSATKPVKTQNPVSHSQKNTSVRQKTVAQDSSKNVKSPKIDTSVKPAKKSPTSDFLSPIGVLDFDGDKLKDPKEMKEKSPEESQKPKKKSKKELDEKSQQKRKKRNIIAGIALIIVLIIGGAILWLCIWGSDILAKITGGDGNLTDLMGLITDNYEPLKTDENGRTNILAFGTSGYDMTGSEGDGTHDGAQLTDSIMAISLDQETGDIAMISLPRDLKVTGSCTWSGKINEVFYVCGESAYPDDEKTAESAGAEALTEEVSDILGLDFQYYAHVNWGSLIEIVDALGGITVTLDEDVDDYYYTGAVYEAGVEYALNGEQALGLARARHGTTNGDFSRGASQQKILIGIKNKIVEENLGVSEMISFANTMGDNLRTNLSASELATAAHLAATLNLDSMRTISLVNDAENIYYFTTATINGISYVIPSAGVGNYSAIREYVAEEIENDPVKKEGASIAVLNATDTPGLAASVAEDLETEGYAISLTDNAPAELDVPNQEYTIYDISGNCPLTLESLEDYLGATTDTSELLNNYYSSYDIIIIIGNSNNI